MAEHIFDYSKATVSVSLEGEEPRCSCPHHRRPELVGGWTVYDVTDDPSCPRHGRERVND